ncbi:MAG: DUF930 domain-containing protein [Hyphomicrobiales bacterium]|nr:MAG: DUF930 domain-containing protein [Hyphomicrobiales bacterium]
MQIKSSWQRRGAGLFVSAAVALTAVPAASAQKAAADWTSKLEPRTRAMQVCSLAGLTAFGKDKKLKPRPDRVVVNAGTTPNIDAKSVSGSTGGVRSGQKWYAFSFKCTLNEAGTKATAFTYELGKEIPKAQWDKLGLWQ